MIRTTLCFYFLHLAQRLWCLDVQYAWQCTSFCIHHGCLASHRHNTWSSHGSSATLQFSARIDHLHAPNQDSQFHHHGEMLLRRHRAPVHRAASVHRTSPPWQRNSDATSGDSSLVSLVSVSSADRGELLALGVTVSWAQRPQDSWRPSAKYGVIPRHQRGRTAISSISTPFGFVQAESLVPSWMAAAAPTLPASCSPSPAARALLLVRQLLHSPG
jgi:hypothetical protein